MYMKELLVNRQIHEQSTKFVGFEPLRFSDMYTNLLLMAKLEYFHFSHALKIILVSDNA